MVFLGISDHSPFLGTESSFYRRSKINKYTRRLLKTRRGTITTRGWLGETRLTRRGRLNEAMTRRGWLGEVDSMRTTQRDDDSTRMTRRDKMCRDHSMSQVVDNWKGHVFCEYFVWNDIYFLPLFYIFYFYWNYGHLSNFYSAVLFHSSIHCSEY